MNFKILGIALLITASTLSARYAGDKSDGQMRTKEDVLKNRQSIRERTEKREEGREIQKKGKNFGKNVKTTLKPFDDFGTTIGNIATASGDVHAKAAAATLKIATMAIQSLGEGIAAVIIGVGRYQERSQEILSITESMVEEITKSEEKIKSLRKKQKELLDLDKAPDNSLSLQKFGKNLYEGRTSAQQKIRKATDIFTDEKVKRLEKLNAVQAALKVENQNYEEIIKVLQIKLMEDTLKEINLKIEIDKTIEKLTAEQKFYESSRKSISTKNSSQAKKQLGEIDEAAAKVTKDLAYYLYFKRHNPPEETPEKLQKKKDDLISEIDKLKPLSKLGESAYLEEKELGSDNLVKRSTIVGVYREMDGMKEKIADLNSRLDALEKAGGAPPRSWVKGSALSK